MRQGGYQWTEAQTKEDTPASATASTMAATTICASEEGQAHEATQWSAHADRTPFIRPRFCILRQGRGTPSRATGMEARQAAGVGTPSRQRHCRWLEYPECSEVNCEVDGWGGGKS